MQWVKTQVHFEQPAQEATLSDYVHEVAHAASRSHSIHEYQSDQPTHIAATAAVCLRLILKDS